MSNHGLTADNMMQQFPIALQKDPKTVALGQAIAKAIRTTSNSVSRLISLQSMRPNISRFCKKSSATKIFGRIWTASFTTRKRSRKRAMLQRFPAPQRCPTRFLCRVLSSRGQSAHTPAPLVRSAQLG